ncbi:MAG: DMT family transporter [Gaiellales bacterium]
MTTLAATAPRADRLALGAALFTVTAWASAFVGIRSAGAHLSPGALSLMRLAVAAAALGAVMGLRREALPRRRHLFRLGVCGVLWFGVYNIALNAGERRVDAGTASMLVNIAPVLIAILAALVLQEGLARNLVLGLAVAFAGVTIIAIATSDGFSLSLGALLCFVAAVVYAVTVIVQKPLLAELSPLTVTWSACVIGLVVCLPFAPQLVSELGDAPAGSIAWSVYLGLVPTAIAFTTWAYALARTDAGKLGATTYLVPPIAIFLGWALLDEVPPGLAFAGGALALAGVVLSRRR